MRFLFLIHGDRQAEAALSADERRAIVAEHIVYGSMLRERGMYVLGEALDDPATAVVVRRGERPSSPTARSPRRRRRSGASTSSLRESGRGARVGRQGASEPRRARRSAHGRRRL